MLHIVSAIKEKKNTLGFGFVMNDESGFSLLYEYGDESFAILMHFLAIFKKP